MADNANQSEPADHSTAAGYSPTNHLHGSLSARGLIGKLPAELRSTIYEEAFTGSEMTLLSAPRGDPPPYPRGGRRSALFSSGHHHLLLTCRYIYDEARTMYWINTTVVNGEENHRFSVDYLLSHLPTFAMQWIQNLRGLVFGYRYNWTESSYSLPRPVQVVGEQHRLRAKLPNLKAYQICETTQVVLPRRPQSPFNMPGVCVNILKGVHRACPPVFERSSGAPVAFWKIKLLNTDAVGLFRRGQAGHTSQKVCTVISPFVFEQLLCETQ